MIIYDKLNSTNGTISIFDSKVNHSVSQNSNIQTQIEKIVSNIYSVLNDKDTQDAACKLLEDNKVNKFFEEYKIQPLMIGNKSGLIFDISLKLFSYTLIVKYTIFNHVWSF